jgi:ferrous iron transport protein B
VLLEEDLSVVLQVGDAKNLRRTLHLAAQLAEMEVPMLLALNMMDEAQTRGLQVDAGRLAAQLDAPVIPTIATRGVGVDAVMTAIPGARQPRFSIRYPEALEQALTDICSNLPAAHISARSLALLWLSGDSLAEGWIQQRIEPAQYAGLIERRGLLEHTLGDSPAAVIYRARETFVEQAATSAMVNHGNNRVSLGAVLGRLSAHPLWGLPILAVVLYVMYWFVGIFGAGTLVGMLEEQLFGEIINPWMVETVNRLIPVSLIADFLVGEYGIWTMGMTYALALLLPIVTTFFITFGILEDSGYLPRLAVLTNRIFRSMGLNGKAVLPMVLGLGCVTMATMTTRILPSKRDRLLAIFLLSLAIPCSAQLGVVLGMLAGVSLGAALIWGGVMLAVLLIVGWLAARLMPGERQPLIVELPPIRMPVLTNVLMKTLARLEWYIKEAVPLFLVGTMLLFVLDKTNVLPMIIEATRPLVTGWLGLPAEASSSFLLGFLRRDFAATGLFAMQSEGILNNVQVVVSIVTITLFVPCIASTFMIVKERGLRTAAAMTVFIIPFAFLIGGLLQRLLILVGWNG